MEDGCTKTQKFFWDIIGICFRAYTRIPVHTANATPRHRSRRLDIELDDEADNTFILTQKTCSHPLMYLCICTQTRYL